MRDRVTREPVFGLTCVMPIAACFSSQQATLTPDVRGTYRIALRVTDSQGAVSDPALLEIEVEEP
jgi:hypothetical protein